MNGACNVNFFFAPPCWGPWEGPKGQISFNFNYKVNFKDLYTKICYAPGVEHWGAWGAKEVFFFKHGHVAYQIYEDDEQNKMQVKFSS